MKSGLAADEYPRIWERGRHCDALRSDDTQHSGGLAGNDQRGRRCLGGRAPADPSTYLYDTGRLPAANAMLNGDEMRARTGWTRLAEDDTTHVFKGAAVLVNDRLAVVLRPGNLWAAYYGLTMGHPVRRGAFGPPAEVIAPGSCSASWKIVENNPGAVMLEVAFQPTSGAATKPATGLRLASQFWKCSSRAD